MGSYFRHFHLHPLLKRNNQHIYIERNKRFSLWIEDVLISGTSRFGIEPTTTVFVCRPSPYVFISSSAAIPTLPSKVRSHASSGVCTEASLCPSRVSKLNSGGVTTWSSGAEFGCADVVCVLHDGEGYRTHFRMLWWICDPWPLPRPALTHITCCRPPFLSPSSSFSFCTRHSSVGSSLLFSVLLNVLGLSGPWIGFCYLSFFLEAMTIILL